MLTRGLSPFTASRSNCTASPRRRPTTSTDWARLPTSCCRVIHHTTRTSTRTRCSANRCRNWCRRRRCRRSSACLSPACCRKTQRPDLRPCSRSSRRSTRRSTTPLLLSSRRLSRRAKPHRQNAPASTPPCQRACSAMHPTPPGGLLAHGVVDGPSLWEEMRLEPNPGIGPARTHAQRPAHRAHCHRRVGRRRAGRSLLGAAPWRMAAVALGPRAAHRGVGRSFAGTAAASAADEYALGAQRAEYDRRQAALEARGAESWGGADFATATGRAAESVGAHDAGNFALARQRLTEASQLLDAVEGRARGVCRAARRRQPGAQRRAAGPCGAGV